MEIKSSCGLCGYQIKRGETLFEHIKLHPTLHFAKRGDKSGHLRPYCTVCNKRVQNYSDTELKKHIHTEVEKTGIISNQNVTVSDLDRFLEQVNKNTALLKASQDKVENLNAVALRYATRIVELQNIIANKN